VTAAGGVVVSGLAIGIDSAAHRGTGGRTIGVLGQGLEARGRSGLRGLTDWVVQRGGLVLSEFPSTYPPGRHTFPQRNRIIAALGAATVVIQAGERSGSLITARLAAEVGREILAVPGSMDAPPFAGCLTLIERGATVVRSERTVLSAAGLLAADGAAALPNAPAGLEDALRLGGRIDEISQRTGLPFESTFRIVAKLEAEGLVMREAGQRYRLALSP
jgi:DNA processing protein